MQQPDYYVADVETGRKTNLLLRNNRLFVRITWTNYTYG